MPSATALRVRDQMDCFGWRACLSKRTLKPCTRGLAAITPIKGGNTASWAPFARAMLRNRLISRRKLSGESNRRICC